MKCLCAKTRRVARLLTRRYEQELQPAGVTPSQFELLSALGAKPHWSQVELCQVLAADQTTLSRNLKGLLDRGWVKRDRTHEDRRVVRYVITAEGAGAWQQALPHWEQAQRAVQQELGEEWEAAWRALERLSQLG